MNRNDPSIDLTIDHATPMKDHNTANLALQKRIGELNAVIIMRDDQMRELQHQLAAAKDLHRDAYIQIEYLHNKFTPTGSGNELLARLNAALK